jgi:hypothetical protein
MGGGESKAEHPVDGDTEEIDRQVAAEAVAQLAAEEQAAAEAAAAGSANDLYASGNLMPATPGPAAPLDGGLVMVGGPASFGPAPTPPGTADRMFAEVNGDGPPWADGGPEVEPMAQRSFGTEVEPNTWTKLAATEEAKPTPAPSPAAVSPVPVGAVGAALAAEREKAEAAAIIDAGIRADEEALMSQIVGEYGTGGAFGTASTGFNVTASTVASAASSEAEDLMSLTELRKEVGKGVELMSTGELIEGLMDETTTDGHDPDETPR